LRAAASLALLRKKFSYELSANLSTIRASALRVTEVEVNSALESKRRP